MLDKCRRRLQHVRHDAQMQASIARQQQRDDWLALCAAKGEEYSRLDAEYDKARGITWRFPPNAEVRFGLLRDWDKDTLRAVQDSIDRLRAELRDRGALDARLTGEA